MSAKRKVEVFASTKGITATVTVHGTLVIDRAGFQSSQGYQDQIAAAKAIAPLMKQRQAERKKARQLPAE